MLDVSSRSLGWDWLQWASGKPSLYGVITVPSGWWTGWMAEWHDGSWLAWTLVVWMTRKLATCLGLAHHKSLCLGQVMCGLSGKCHSGKEGSQDLFTLARATTKAAPQLLTRQGKQAQCYISNTRPSARNDHSKHRPLNRTEHYSIWQTLFLPPNWERQGKTNVSGPGSKTDMFWHDVT